MASPPRSRDEILEIYLKVVAQVRTVEHRRDDFLELNRHVETLNAVAPSFLRLVQTLLIGDAVLALCRVTDNAEDRRKERLSVGVLRRAVPGAPALRSVRSKMTPLRDLRNNWISHSDLKTALREAKATLILKDLDVAIEELKRWLDDFGTMAGMPTDEPTDQGTWISAPSLTAALRDAVAVQEAYEALLASSLRHVDAALRIDEQLTANRRSWEECPFSESEWLSVRRRVLESGLTKALNELDPDSPYAVILSQAQDPDEDLTRNWTDRRLAARVYSKADWLVREIQHRQGKRVTGLVFAMYEGSPDAETE